MLIIKKIQLNIIKFYLNLILYKQRLNQQNLILFQIEQNFNLSSIQIQPRSNEEWVHAINKL